MASFLSRRASKKGHLHGVLFCWRSHPSSNSGSARQRQDSGIVASSSSNSRKARNSGITARASPRPPVFPQCQRRNFMMWHNLDSRGRLSLRRLERVNFRDIDAQVLHPAPKCAIMKSERRRRYEKRGIFKGRKHIHMF